MRERIEKKEGIPISESLKEDIDIGKTFIDGQGAKRIIKEIWKRLS